jgi:hypothetical protein
MFVGLGAWPLQLAVKLEKKFYFQEPVDSATP